MTGGAAGRRVTVFLCEDAAEMRALLRYGLDEDPALQVVGDAGDGETGIARIGELGPDVVLLDLSMPGLDGLEAIPRIRAASPQTRIVVLSGFTATRMREQVLEAGADRYLEKGESLAAIRAAIREAVGWA